MERERDELQTEADRCSGDLCTLRQEEARAQEECRLTAAVNAKQTNQIAEKEGRVCELLGEVEVLRARKVVLMKWLCDGDSEKCDTFSFPDSSSFYACLHSIPYRGLRLELESVREELRSCRENYAVEVLSLTQQLEAERTQRTEGDDKSGRSLVRGGRGQQGSRKAEQLRSQLRGQVEQSNYLRVKLGQCRGEKGLK